MLERSESSSLSLPLLAVPRRNMTHSPSLP
uniref:Uncharacterized protein n=1 Tax=Siphoviridae sp. ctUWs1 TaxID=2826352 RepID=A0A8S5QTB5_9CAUD|nr:MAG TPA: hypothetical protein [Siphoviridae sp. ctUWs1]